MPQQTHHVKVLLKLRHRPQCRDIQQLGLSFLLHTVRYTVFTKQCACVPAKARNLGSSGSGVAVAVGAAAPSLPFPAALSGARAVHAQSGEQGWSPCACFVVTKRKRGPPRNLIKCFQAAAPLLLWYQNIDCRFQVLAIGTFVEVVAVWALHLASANLTLFT